MHRLSNHAHSAPWRLPCGSSPLLRPAALCGRSQACTPILRSQPAAGPGTAGYAAQRPVSGVAGFPAVGDGISEIVVTDCALQQRAGTYGSLGSAVPRVPAPCPANARLADQHGHIHGAGRRVRAGPPPGLAARRRRRRVQRPPAVQR